MRVRNGENGESGGSGITIFLVPDLLSIARSAFLFSIRPILHRDEPQQKLNRYSKLESIVDFFLIYNQSSTYLLHAIN